MSRIGNFTETMGEPYKEEPKRNSFLYRVIKRITIKYLMWCEDYKFRNNIGEYKENPYTGFFYPDSFNHINRMEKLQKEIDAL